MGTRTIIMVMADALRHDYITAEDAPFLHGLAQGGVRGSLAPSFGFEPDGAYLAGLTPEQCDGGAQFWLRPGDTLFRAVPLFALLDRLPDAGWRALVRKGARAVAQAFAIDPVPRSMADPVFIPYDQLARFSLSSKHLPDDPRAMHGASVFEHARRLGMTVHVHAFPAHKVKTDIVAERYLAADRGQNDFAFLFFGDLDGIGHRFGPDSVERCAMLRTVDAALERVWQHARRHYSEVVLVVFGDHGMAEVRGHVDVRPVIERAGLDVRCDSWFIDSTFARFWINNLARREHLKRELQSLQGGRLINDTDRAAWSIRYAHNWFGDEIFAVDDHLLLHPSFYANGVAPKGMHGYLPGCRDNESAFVLGGDGIPALAPREHCDMRRVYSTIVSLIDPTSSVPVGLPSLLT